MLNQFYTRLKKDLSIWFGLLTRTRDCLGCKSKRVINVDIIYTRRYTSSLESCPYPWPCITLALLGVVSVSSQSKNRQHLSTDMTHEVGSK